MHELINSFKEIMKYDFDKITRRENTNSVKYDLREEYFGKADVLPMWVADMDFETPGFIRSAIIKRAMHPIYGYTVRKDSFFDSIISWMKKMHDWKVEKDWISFSPGIVPALNMCILAFTKPGDKIMIQPPVYFPFFRAVKDHGRILTENVLLYKNGKYEIDFADFEKKAKDLSAFILCHPHNPVGRVWNYEELKKIVSICKKNNVLILSDEIHSDLILPGNRHIPLLNIAGAEDISISMYAPSKTFNLAGLSTSFLIIPDKNLKLKYDRVIDNLHMGMGNIFGNVALEAAYDHGEEWLEQLLDYIQENIDYLRDFLKNRIPEVKCIEPEATYLVWLDFNSLGMDDRELKDFIIHKAGLGLNHGPVFGKGGEGFQRINVASPRELLKKALLKLEEAIKALDK
ncbi:MAG: MalY/PatB family protein [Bacteroidota bacterium]